MRRVAAALAVAVALICAPAALAADPLVVNIPWPQLLPPKPVTTAVQPHPVANCPDATIACVDGLARRLEEQWRAYDSTCDHRAVMALSYLRITQAIRDDLARKPRPELFSSDTRWFIYATTTFSNRYFKWADAYAHGQPVPQAWKIAYDAMTQKDITGGQDILLFSNAHVQRDLPFAYEEMGLRAPDGTSHKPDHDAVNEINKRILDPTQDEVSARYDPFFSLVDLKPSPLDELGSMEVVKTWREGAWRNAERLLNAKTPAEHQRVVDSIETGATVWANMIASVQVPGYRKLRDDYCRAQAGAAAAPSQG